MTKKPRSPSPWVITKPAKVRLAILLLLLISFGVWAGLVFSEPTTPEQAADRAKLLERVYRGGNYIEAGIWGIISLGFAFRFIRCSRTEKFQAAVAVVTFLLFGISDLVEVQTGAWWHPWWLLVWKSLCVLSMISLLIAYHLKGLAD
ncbi:MULTISPECIES: hypothetical protein [unclassified Coleofasciculus]|uniref:hypothetical protein n=1 Tax=unclassified Coleofasciculus TaxID=2692782 RepID=UPI0018820855|nr:MULTISPECIES: hypothetical protein [unclassified Coleofasciculus]MBE9129107.1 hypothetical protein [Coleofasciculus sp. LEGE 07081]MBE9151779.1 hypothetical protein [Coleofasciculus sp. LEGE 07092]